MKMFYVLVGSVELIFALIVMVLAFVIGFKALSVFTREYDDEKEIQNNNIAVGILTAAFLVCVGMSLKVVAGPATSTLRNIIMAPDHQISQIILAAGMVILHLAIGGIVSVLTLFLSIFLLTKVSPIKDLKGVMNNNIAVALVISGIMLVTTMLIADPLLFMLQGLIPQFEIPNP